MTTTHRVMLRDGEFDGSDFGGEGGHWMSRLEPTRTTRTERLAELCRSTGYICMPNHVSLTKPSWVLGGRFTAELPAPIILAHVTLR
ncbi:hypothetical protein Moror_11506 [Moniliophthora roreri MCA 2997]|uniref:Uncharacterized protein n=1 Tax=Moniliophthora roreri (strain MCA 2997) TaxID=1381753 RepID=V2WUY8_MONRO|nr:hypothetical protein Moror_11506 [Moniliophthora roreri MCA 2997]